jgi:hypothetical protein
MYLSAVAGFQLFNKISPPVNQYHVGELRDRGVLTLDTNRDDVFIRKDK